MFTQTTLQHAAGGYELHYTLVITIHTNNLDIATLQHDISLTTMNYLCLLLHITVVISNMDNTQQYNFIQTQILIIPNTQ